VPAAMVNPMKDGMPTIDAKYSKVGESLRYNTPSEMQCSMFCGGRRCKYESAAQWKQEDMAINGLYSHWITDDLVSFSFVSVFNKKTFNRLHDDSLSTTHLYSQHAKNERQ
jgi:protein tyrosine phosphatase domain-containing protein 1